MMGTHTIRSCRLYAVFGMLSGSYFVRNSRIWTFFRTYTISKLMGDPATSQGFCECEKQGHSSWKYFHLKGCETVPRLRKERGVEVKGMEACIRYHFNQAGD